MIPIYRRKFILGNTYDVFFGGILVGRCLFIRATNKGFNFLNLEKSETILKRHIYGIKMAGKQIPSIRPLELMFSVPDYITVKSTERVTA